MRRIQIVVVVALILAALIFAYSQAPQTRSRTGQTETQTQSVQPVKAKKILVKELPKGLKGIVLKDGFFRLAPGYKFERKTSNTIVVALKSGSPGNSLKCWCVDPDHPSNKGGGACIFAEIIGGLMGCRPDPWDRCDGACSLDWTVSGKSIPLAIF